MSFNVRNPLNDTISERAAALRDKADAERRHAIHAQLRSQEMAKRDWTPTGIVRADLRTKEARSKVGAANRKIDEGLDEVRQQFAREAQARDAERAERSTDAERAPALDNPRGGR